jgi:hypothetical protein
MPWRLIGETVRVVITGGVLRVSHAGREVAVHPHRSSRFERVVDPLHYAGVVGSGPKPRAEITRFPDAAGPSDVGELMIAYTLMGC